METLLKAQVVILTHAQLTVNSLNGLLGQNVTNLVVVEKANELEELKSNLPTEETLAHPLNKLTFATPTHAQLIAL